MTTEPKNNGRNSDGRFSKGNKLGGKKPGSRHKVTLAVEALLEGEHEGLTRKAIELAMAGDTTALKLCLDRLSPPRKDRPIEIDLPPVNTSADTLRASRATIGAMLRGEITPSEAGRVMTLISAHNALIEACDLERRISLLEIRMENDT